jgi:hypothetical protein
MEYADRLLEAEGFLDKVENALEVGDKPLPVVMFQLMERVLPMVAKVEQNHLITLAQQCPKRQVAVDREAVAMA